MGTDVDVETDIEPGDLKLRQRLSTLQPVSLLNANVAGRGYSLVSQDLALVGNTVLLEKFVASNVNVAESDLMQHMVCAVYPLNNDQLALTFNLHWPQRQDAYARQGLWFGHAVVCNVPRSEESYLALSDLALGLQRHYETNYADIGAMMTQVAHDPIQTDWAEAFLQLPQQLPPSINQQSRALLVNLRKVVQPPNLPPPQPTQPNRLLVTSGWLVAAVLAILLVLASRR